MRNLLLYITTVLVLVWSSSNSAQAEVDQIELHTNSGTLSELQAANLISDQGFSELLDQNIPSDTELTVRVSRSMAKLSAQIQRGDDVGAFSSPDHPEDGDEREHRWERIEDDSIFAYVRVERYFVDDSGSGWREVHFSRTRIGSAPGDGE